MDEFYSKIIRKAVGDFDEKHKSSINNEFAKTNRLLFITEKIRYLNNEKLILIKKFIETPDDVEQDLLDKIRFDIVNIIIKISKLENEKTLLLNY